MRHFISMSIALLIACTACWSQTEVTRSIEYRQISNFTTSYSISSMKMSADGSRVVFATGGAMVKIFTINADGSGLAQVYDFQRTGYGPFIDISADGDRVIWCDWIGDGSISIANADGSGQKKLVTLLPHPDPVFADMRPEVPLAPRMTANGGQVYFIHNHRDPRGTGVWRINSDGSDLTQVFNYLDMAQQVFDRDVSADINLGFGNGFDISADGDKIVVGTVNFKLATGDLDRGDAVVFDSGSYYHAGEYAIGNQPFSTFKDGGQIVMFKREYNAGVGYDEINVYFVPLGTGDPIKVVSGLDIFGAAAMTQMAGDGSRAIIMAGNGRLPITLVDRVSASRFDLVSIDGISLAIGGFRFSESFLPSINWNGDRFCFVANSNPPQIWVASINSNALTSLPSIALVKFEPDFVLRNGSTTSTFQAYVTSAPHTIQAVTFEAFRDGALQFRALTADWPYAGMLVDNGQFGDAQANDGYFSNNTVRADLPETPAGPYTVRLAAVNSTLRYVTMVDAEPFSILDHPTSIGETTTAANFTLQQNYPNPFNSMTRIDYSIPEASRVELKVFDLLGNETNHLVNDFQQKGFHSVHHDAKHLPSGIYLYVLRAGDFVEMKKMVLMR